MPYREYASGLLADYLGVADDWRWEPRTTDWLERQYRDDIDGTSEGLRKSLVGLEGGITDSRNSEQAALVASDVKRDAEIAFARARFRRDASSSAVLASGAGRERGERFDCFISHAGEDRAEVEQPLAEELERRNRSVWFSGFELTLGDSLRRKIDEGVSRCRFGVVILSPHFFEKPRPEAELDALVARSMIEDRKVVWPVWHNVTKEVISSRATSLAGLLGIETHRGLGVVAHEIIRALDFEKR